MTAIPAPHPSDKVALASALKPETVSAGKMQIVSLGAVKDRLGPRWARASERVRSRLEDALRPRMAPGDIILPLDDASFLVVFTSHSRETAQLECYAAAREVLLKLFGDQVGDVQVRTVVGEMDGGLVTEDVDVGRIVEEALEREGEELVVESLSPPSVEQAREQRDAAPIPKWAPAAPPELRPPEFTFNPIWTYAKGAVLSYICEAGIDPNIAELSSFEAEREIANADLALLEHVQGELKSAVENGRRLMIYCPVHYSTLTHWRFGSSYFGRAREAGEAAQQLVVWVVRGISRGAPYSRLVECLPRLQGCGRATYCEVDPDDPHLNRFSNLGVRALGVRWAAEYDHDAVLVTRGFAFRATTAGFRTFATGLDTPAPVVAAIAAGIHELEGAAVRGSVASPDTAFRLSLLDLFQPAPA